MTSILVDRGEPMDCGQGCLPPHTPMPVRGLEGDERAAFVNHTYSHRAGDRWLCPHGVAYKAYDPSTAHQTCMFRSWRKLGPIASWFARRAARNIKEDTE